MMRPGLRPFATAFLTLAVLPVSPATAAQPPEPPLRRDTASFSPVVKKALPAVVSIEGRRPSDPPRAPTKPDDIDPGFGSGVIFDPAGFVLTNNHLVQDAEVVDVTMQDGRKFVSRDIRRDPKSDLAVIRVESKDPLPFLEFGDSDAMEVGDRVLALGAPFGLMGSVTHGIVSAKGRGNLKLNHYEDWLQTDAAVNPGNSGGPLVNLEGKVVGITAAIKTRSGGFSGVGLAVASNLCKSVSTQLAKDGVVRRGYLGANLLDLNEELARKFSVVPGTGAVVNKVYDNSPAAKAGFAVGDVISFVGGRHIRDGRDVQRIITSAPLGQSLDVAVLRDGKAHTLKVVVEEQPAAFGLPAGVTSPTPTPGLPTPQPVPAPAVNPTPVPFRQLGFGAMDLTADAAARLGYPANIRGAVIVNVAEGTAAERAGLRTGQVIVKVDRTAITSVAGLQQALALAIPEKGALVQVLRPSGETEFIVLRVN